MMNLDYPFHFDSRGCTAVTDDEDHIRDMIEQFLFTNLGERVNRPTVGSGILQVVFAPNSSELASALQFTIQAGLQDCMGDLIDIKSLTVSNENASLIVMLEYAIRRTGEHRNTVFKRD
jgi:phage baseplate assembly protein W